MSIIRIIERSLFVWPECMREWIASLGPVEEVLDIRIHNEVLVEPIKSWESWSPIMRRTITIFRDDGMYVQRFILKDAVWYQVKEK
jgi:hypothetical protein